MNGEDSENPNTLKLDPVFQEAHSVHSELYHSTVQIVNGSPNAEGLVDEGNTASKNLREPNIQSGFLPNRPGSQIKDPPSEKGIMQREELNEDSTSCADTFCLVLAFLVIFVSMIAFIVVVTKGEENQLVTIDNQGKQCGGSGVEGYPFLFMTTGTTPAGVCVSGCPRNASDNATVYGGKNVTFYDTAGYDSLSICVPLEEKTLGQMEQSLKFNCVNLIVDEFQDSVNFFMYVTAFSSVLGFFFLFILRILKKFAVYILIFMNILILLATGVLTLIYTFTRYDLSQVREINALESFRENLNYFSGFLIVAIVLIVYSMYWIFQTVVYWKNGELDKLSKLIKTAKDINKQYKFLWVIGLFSYLLTMLFIGFLVVFFVYLVPLYSSPTFSFTEFSQTSTSEMIVFKIMAYFSVPVTLWLCSSFLSFSQFALAIFSVAKYFPPVNPSVTDHKTRIFTNKLNYHVGSIFLGGFGILLTTFLGFFVNIFLFFLKPFSKCCPKINNFVLSLKKCMRKIKEKFSGNGFLIIALRNMSFFDANNLVAKITAKNSTKYPLEGNTGDLIGVLCGTMGFCGVCLFGLGLLMTNMEISISFLPILTYAGLGYFCGISMSEQYWYEINIVYLLFCICEEVLGRREENQYSYENQIVHSKINDIGGIYSIIKISRENEQFSQNYNQMQ